MALLAQLDRDGAELYVLRFIVRKSSQSILFCHPKYAPLVDFAQFEWCFDSSTKILVSADRSEITKLTSAHFNLVQANADAFTQLLVWFPPVRRIEDADEARLLQRAGVVLR